MYVLILVKMFSVIVLYICVKFLWKYIADMWHEKKRLFSIPTMFKGPQLQNCVHQSYGFCVLHVVPQCFTFVRNFIIISQMVFNLQCEHEDMVEMAMFNVQRAITLKIGKPELWFICSALHLIVLYIWVKFQKNISDSISYGADTNDGSTDRRIDRHTDGWTDRQKLKIL